MNHLELGKFYTPKAPYLTGQRVEKGSVRITHWNDNFRIHSGTPCFLVSFGPAFNAVASKPFRSSFGGYDGLVHHFLVGEVLIAMRIESDRVAIDWKEWVYEDDTG
jgi:hypothetical protein